MRIDGRSVDELRPVKITPAYLKNPPGSCLIEVGDTKVICTATIDERVPPFLKGASSGWITAEYSMLPGATAVRSPREASRGKLGGRTVEIQRLIGRSLRTAVDLTALGERTIWIDCDVIQADGGTRTISITGGFVALALALDRLASQCGWQTLPIQDYIAAVSVGVHEGKLVTDLSYAEDSKAEVDMNVVMTGSGEYIEIQGTGEHASFSRDDLGQLLDLARNGIKQLVTYQVDSLGEIANKIKKPSILDD